MSACKLVDARSVSTARGVVLADVPYTDRALNLLLRVVHGNLACPALSASAFENNKHFDLDRLVRFPADTAVNLSRDVIRSKTMAGVEECTNQALQAWPHLRTAELS